MSSFIALIGVITLCSVLLVIGRRYQSLATSDFFHIEDKNISLWQLVFGIFSVVGGGEFIAVSALAYSFGLWSAFLFGGFAIGALLLSVMAKRLRQFNGQHKTQRELDVFSIPDFLYIFCGKHAARITTFYTILALGSLLLIQFSLGGLMLQLLIDIPYSLAVILMACTVGTYVYWGGFRSILVTDALQVCVLFGLFTWLAIFLPSPLTSLNEVWSVTQTPDTATLSVLLAGGICWAIGGGDIWHRVLAAHSDTTARRGLIMNTAMLIVFGLLLAFLGTKIAAIYPSVSPDDAFQVMLSNLTGVMQMVVALALLAGFLSTADTELHAIATMINKEVSRGTQEPISTKRTKALIVLINLLSIILAIALANTLLSVYYVLLNLFIIIGCATLPIIYGRGKPNLVTCGLLLSGLCLIILTATGYLLTGANSLLVGIPALVCSAIGRAKQQV